MFFTNNYSRIRIDFTQDLEYIFFFMAEGYENAQSVLGYISSANKKTLCKSLKRLDNLNIRGCQLYSWRKFMYICCNEEIKKPEETLNDFLSLNQVTLNEMVDYINSDIENTSEHKAKLYLSLT